MPADHEFPTDLQALQRDYELIRELGQGGMAAVYLARRRETGALVAIKAIRARYLDDPDALRRFAREARTVAHLNHPNIVRTEAIEQIGDRAVAIIMAYVPGGTVRNRLREYGPFSAEECERVLRDVANALGYAHRRGIVHRDVKPENVFLETRDGRALLSDFGIARRIEGDVPITQLGAAVGTPQYMSPEQIDGRAVDGRSDIYSLGVLGWELLTGVQPWAGENLYGVIYKQKHEELPRITSLRPRVPANLLFAIEGALVKDREKRWQSVDEFLRHLTYDPPPVLAKREAVAPPSAEDEPTIRFRRAAPDPAPEPKVTSRKNVRRRRLMRALALLAPLAVAGTALYVVFDGRSRNVVAPQPNETSRSSNGGVAADSERFRDSGSVASATTQAVSPSTGSTDLKPAPPRAPTTKRETSGVKASRADSSPATPAPPSRNRPTMPVPSPRCRIARMADQRACLLAYIAANDAQL